jgi:hypothetical protein
MRAPDFHVGDLKEAAAVRIPHMDICTTIEESPYRQLATAPDCHVKCSLACPVPCMNVRALVKEEVQNFWTDFVVVIFGQFGRKSHERSVSLLVVMIRIHAS